MIFWPINLMLSLFFLLAIISVIIWIQVKLSRSSNKYLGLILPVLSLLTSVLMVLSYTTFSAGFYEISTSAISINEDTGEETEEIVSVEQGREKITSGAILGITYLFLISNIPTVILGGIHVSERNKINVQKSIEKMKIEDL